jgi:hypothetical protein
LSLSPRRKIEQGSAPRSAGWLPPAAIATPHSAPSETPVERGRQFRDDRLDVSLRHIRVSP